LGEKLAVIVKQYVRAEKKHDRSKIT